MSPTNEIVIILPLNDMKMHWTANEAIHHIVYNTIIDYILNRIYGPNNIQ